MDYIHSADGNIPTLYYVRQLHYTVCLICQILLFFRKSVYQKLIHSGNDYLGKIPVTALKPDYVCQFLLDVSFQI